MSLDLLLESAAERRLLLEAAWHALENAGIAPSSLANSACAN